MYYKIAYKHLKTYLPFILISVGLAILSFYNYLIFHTLIELFTFIIAATIFLISFNTYEINSNSFFAFLGIAYLFAGSIDLVHTFTYKGIDILNNITANEPTQLWISARYIESLSLLIAPLFFKRSFKRRYVTLIYTIITTIIIISILYFKTFPVAFIEGEGLTLFKVVSEYTISFILIISLFHIKKHYKYFNQKIEALMKASIILTILSELSFTLYIDVYDISNMGGHILKFASFYILYRALVESTLKDPYYLINRKFDTTKNVLFKTTNILLEENKQKESYCRSLKLLAETNKNLIDSNKYTITELIQLLCNTIQGVGEYTFVWFVSADKKGNISPIASSSLEDDSFLDTIYPSKYSISTLFLNPITTKKTITLQNISSIKTRDHWFNEVLSRGYLSTISIPFKLSKDNFAVLNIYANSTDRFNLDENYILQILVNNLSYVIDSISTEFKKRQAEIDLEFLFYHDNLTKLHNRNFFDLKMEEYKEIGCPYTIFTCDIDGLGEINKTKGYEFGNEILISFSNILKKVFSQGEIMIRYGGSEFIVFQEIKSDNPAIYIKQINELFNELINKDKGTSYTVSMGYSSSTDENDNPQSLLKNAKAIMGYQKLFHNNSSKSITIRILNKTLEARDYVTQVHSNRLEYSITRFAEFLNLSCNKKSRLTLLAKFHDIGKLGISDTLLNKPAKLTEEEMEYMKKHSEIGAHIANSTPDLENIANLILYHHEHWDGKGYPIGLKGEDIPLECRILSIVDAYDAMVNDRPYRKALDKESAIEELKRCSGTTFDPYLVDEFINYIELFNL